MPKKAENIVFVQVYVSLNTFELLISFYQKSAECYFIWSDPNLSDAGLDRIRKIIDSSTLR